MDMDCEVHTHLIWNDIVAAITDSTRRLHANDVWLREGAWRQGNQHPNGSDDATRTSHINYHKISVGRSGSNTRWSLQILMFRNVPIACCYPPNSSESGIIAAMKASLWLSIVILLGAGSLQAQTVYHPGQVIHVSVTFDGPYVVKIKGVQVVASIPAAPDSQPGFKTEMFFTESKPTGPNTFDVSYRVPDNQASGDYPLKQIRASLTDSSLTLFYESEKDFTGRILKIENVQSFVKPKIKDVQVP